ncbi:MAG: toxic anion resistance protein [Firmicutes bacterium]|nr:toxic anion resistance protein [Bacillota bacterium]
MSDTITLTLNPTAAAPIPAEPELEAAKMDETILTPEEQKVVDEFSKQIDINDTNLVLQYGAAAQQKIAGFSENALNSVRTKDLGEVGDMITDLVTELKGFDINEDEGGFFSFLKRGANKITGLKARYDKAEVNVNRIVSALDAHQIQLLKDIATLDQMYELNLKYFKELSMYILAGKKKLKEAREVELAALVAKAKASGLPEDAQKANDFDAMCTRFEKKLYDLELTRTISLQMAPQIRLVQNNDTLMAEKIQSTLVNTIPLWKSQMVIAMGLTHSQQAMEAQKAVTDMTNELLRKNSEALKTATIATAKESERGIVDLETLQKTNEDLISTLDEVVRIQQEGKEKRRAAEVELHRIENEMKAKLLDIKNL